MPKPKRTAGTGLRQKALSRLAKEDARAPSFADQADSAKLVNELKIHQVELEIQNEELRRARAELEAEHARYVDLYEFAPAGYLTLDGKGFIKAVNLAGATLLGLERARLVQCNFASYVHGEDHLAYRAFLKRVFSSDLRQSCELCLCVGNKCQLFVRMEGAASKSGQECRVVLVDITDKRVSEALRKLLRVLPVATMISTLADGKIIDVNDTFETILGRAKAEVLGKTALELGLWESAEDRRQYVLALKRNSCIQNLETVFRTRDKTTRTVLISCELIEMSGEECIVSVFWDISERKRMEQELRDREERLSAFIQASFDVIYSMSPDWEQMHQLSGKAFIADTLKPSRDWLDTYIPEDEWERVLSKISEAALGQTVFDYVHRIRRVDGSLGWAHSRAVPVRDAAGVVREWFGTVKDITQEKHAENRLRESEEKFRTAFRSVPCALTLTSFEDGKFLEVNDTFERLTGYTRKETLQKTTLELGIWIDLEARQRLITTLRQNGYFRNAEVDLRVKNGARITVLMSAELIEISGMHWIVSAWLDITERKRLEQDLSASKDRLEDMNAALRVILEQREQDRPNMERRVLDNMRLLVGPYLEAIRSETASPGVLRNLDLAQRKFEDLTSGFARTLNDQYKALTGSEIRVADMIRAGMTSKEIASALGLSVATANFYRASIRKKLGLSGKKAKLGAFLQSIPNGKPKPG